MWIWRITPDRPDRGLGKIDLLGVVDGRLAGIELERASGSERLTGAIVNRLTHHVNILEMNGDSCQLRQSRKAQG